MKFISTFALSLLLGSLIYAGNPQAPPVEKKSILFLNKYDHPVFVAGCLPADTGFQNRYAQLYQIEQKIHSGKAVTIAGIGLFAGGALVTLAAVGFSNEIANINNNYYNSYYAPNYSRQNTTGLTTGAVMCYIVGPSCLIAAIPLIVIGAVHWSEGNFEKRYYVEMNGTAGPNGMGMKMTF